jgi:hypothetical protein
MLHKKRGPSRCLLTEALGTTSVLVIHSYIDGLIDEVHRAVRKFPVGYPGKQRFKLTVPMYCPGPAVRGLCDVVVGTVMLTDAV